MLRHKVGLTAVIEPRRAMLVADLVATIERLLAEAYGEGRGIDHQTTWAVAPRVGSGSQELRDRCREARVEVTRGPDWGVVVHVSPTDWHHTTLWLGTYPQARSVAAARRRAHSIGIAVGIVGGIATSVVLGRSGWRPENPRSFIAIGGLVMLGVMLVAMTYTNYLYWRSQRRLESDVRHADAVLGRAWDAVRGQYPGLEPLKPRQSPTVFNAAVALASAAVAGVSYLSFWSIEPTSSTMSAVVIGIGIAGVLAGFCAFLFTLFTIFEWIGVDVYGLTLKSGD